MSEREPETLVFNDEAEPELELNTTIDDFIDNPSYSDDDGTPDELRPKRKYRSRKKEKETVEAISESLAMLNGMFAMMVPCTCANTLDEPLRELGAHRDSCAKLYPLSEQESASLSAAIAAEFRAHPEWVDKLENADTWVAHFMLISAIGGIIISRRMRTGQVMFPPEIPPEEIQRVLSANGAVHA